MPADEAVPVTAPCKICKEDVTFKVRRAWIKGCKNYPYEHQYIHRNQLEPEKPEHCLTVYIDQDYRVRDHFTSPNVTVARREAARIDPLVRMTERQALCAVYAETLRARLHERLTRGPASEEDLLEELEGEEGFELGKFNWLVTPLLKAGLVKTGWSEDLGGRRVECFFLVEDFLALRVPSAIPGKLVAPFAKVKTWEELRLAASAEVRGRLLAADGSAREAEVWAETDLCLSLLADPEVSGALEALERGPAPRGRGEFSEAVGEKVEGALIATRAKGRGGEAWLPLLEVKVKRFVPEYMLPRLVNLLRAGEISRAMYDAHLGLLYEAAGKG